MARDISGGACFVAAAVDRSDGYCKEGRGGRYYIWQRWIAALMLLGGGGGRNMRRSRDPLRTGVLGGYHNSRYLLLFASIAWLYCLAAAAVVICGAGGGRETLRIMSAAVVICGAGGGRETLRIVSPWWQIKI